MATLIGDSTANGEWTPADVTAALQHAAAIAKIVLAHIKEVGALKSADLAPLILLTTKA